MLDSIKIEDYGPFKNFQLGKLAQFNIIIPAGTPSVSEAFFI